MERRAITIVGIVQGVGFRPYVYRLASQFALYGFVKNNSGDVEIEVEGDLQNLDRFCAELPRDPPPLARIERLSWTPRPPRGELDFRIEGSESVKSGPIFFSPDVATCDDCLREMNDPLDRRYLYPFLNCTNCGPRLTIIKGAPYDRARTTMADFPMCAACRAEYEDPANRRFHAQPIACRVCGPQLEFRGDASGEPLRAFADSLQAGKIGALKGLGGYHLLCLANADSTVRELRRRKERDAKPFALMVRDLASADLLCEIDTLERELLTSPGRPVVLLRRRPDSDVAADVAPGNPMLGVMLPYTPLHHLLFRELGNVPLVMTSGNRSDEPIAYDDADAIKRLADIADVFLMHDRPIHIRCDDSVTRVVDGFELPLRRSRGYAPQPLRLPFSVPVPILAVGSQLKATFALGIDLHAFLSHHLGDLDHYEALRAFQHDITLYETLFALDPVLLACDLHPNYASSRYARERGKPLLTIQHHHAHMASCMADNGLKEFVIGVSFDGTGYGTDGAVWGGEFLIGDYRQFQRAAHFVYVGMPGADQAIREPWRMALAHLHHAEAPNVLEGRIPSQALRIATTMLERELNTPKTSSAGRLFDAVSALLGLRDQVDYEGQAAIELEWLATRTPRCGSYDYNVESGEALVIDTRPMIREIAREVVRKTPVAVVARRFHSTLVEIIADVCGRLRNSTELDRVVLSGGVFLNALLTREVCERLKNDGFDVYRHRQVPPGDGGLSLGQLAIAAHQMS